jgi:putative FmdB family regulatory protein
LLKILQRREGVMPRYDYVCQKCKRVFSESHSILQHAAADPRCPECGASEVTREFAPFFTKTSRKS